MRKIKEEKVLLYNFSEQENLQKVQDFFSGLHIKTIVTAQEDYYQKIGFLLGLTGFSASPKPEEDNFDFTNKVMVLHNIKGKRLDEILQKMRKNKISTPYKAVVTPLNRFWTLKRLCFNMYKEHGAMLEQQKKRAENAQ